MIADDACATPKPDEIFGKDNSRPAPQLLSNELKTGNENAFSIRLK
jgi:hypothetical protein